MLYLALTEKQTFAVDIINEQASCFRAVCTSAEWQELVDACYCWRDGSLYRAHEVYTTPDFEMSAPDARGLSSETAERDFELRREYLYESGKLQL